MDGKLTWIHLSDLHFEVKKNDGNSIEQEIICRKILDDIEELKSQYKLKPDYIFITGDIVFNASNADEFSAAKKWINLLLSRAECSKEQVFIVPGNHDVDRSYLDSNIASQTIHGAIRDEKRSVDDYYDKSVQPLIWPKFKHFSEFSSDYGDSCGITQAQPYYCKELQTNIGKINILGLNTSLASFDDEDSKENIFIGKQVSLELEKTDKNNITIVLQHHPLSWISDSKNIESILQNRPHIILSGHTHDQDAYHLQSFSKAGIIEFVGGAGFDKKSTQFNYSWGEISDDGIRYYPRAWNKKNNGFFEDSANYPKLIEKGNIKLSRNDLPKSWESLLNETPSVTNHLNKERAREKTTNHKQDKKKGREKSSTETTGIISLINDMVAYNQCEYFQTSFLASRLSDSLREAKEVTPYKDDALKERIKALENFLMRNTRKHYKQHFEYLKKHFSKRNSHNFPRISVKTNCMTSNESEGVIAIARDRGGVKLDENASDISNNTGFLSLKTDGEYYLCNNIPEEILAGKYVNPRIDISKAKSYKFRPEQSGVDHDWIRCWVPKLDPSRFEECYKSTLIIPMTLKNSDLDESFIKEFKLFDNSETMNMDNIDNLIFSYLCFDHVNTDYFNKEEDVAIGAIFARAMTPYMLTNLRYTSASRSYTQVRKYLKNVDSSEND